jgi:uncharacterized damage-inducible protein DinB
VTREFPSPTVPADSRQEVLLRYLDYFRDVVVEKVSGLPAGDRSASRLPSGWTPLQLLKHLTYVEMRWLHWGFEGHDVADPWGDARDDKWYVADDETLAVLVSRLDDQGETTRAVVRRHELEETGRPGPRWDGDDPPSLERVLLHLVQEYARHAGHLDIVRELADGSVGE